MIKVACSTKTENTDFRKKPVDDSWTEFKTDDAKVMEMEENIRNILRFTAGTDALFFFDGIVV